MRRFTAHFITLTTFGALLLFFGESSLAASIPQSYEGSVSRVFNDPTGDQINPGDPVTGTLTYNPSSTETNGSLTAWIFVADNFALQSNSSAFSYFEQDPGFWIFDLAGDVSGTIGVSRPKLNAPQANRFADDDDSPLGQQIFDITMNHIEAMIDPHSVLNNFRRESVPFVMAH